MKSAFLSIGIITASILGAGQALAHSAGAVLDPAGNNASATDLAEVTCYDDGNGPPHHLYTQIQDLSPPVPGLLLSTQIFKGNQMTNATDTVSGDPNPSSPATINGGAGTYYISVSKTNVGARSFNITYHCQTVNDVHTGTDIQVDQAQ